MSLPPAGIITNGTYDPSATFLDYTYAYGKYSCITWVYPLHVLFAYLVAFTGAFALLSRVLTVLKPYHSLSGRLYLGFMFWCMATSLLIHNTGLPFFVIVSFLYLAISMTSGHLLILFHQQNFQNTIWQRVQARLNDLKGSSAIKLQELKQEEIEQYNINRTFTQRLFSLKALHGALMTFSWCQIVGRLFVTNPSTSWHGCWTYPAYKSTDGHAEFIDGQGPPIFAIGEGNFLIALTLSLITIIAAVAVGVSYCGSRHSDSKVSGSSANLLN